MHIVVKNGLDIPIEGAPAEGTVTSVQSKQVAYDFRPYASSHLLLSVAEGDRVMAGGCLVEDKSVPERRFVSPIDATVVSIVRGEKRRLLEIILERTPLGSTPLPAHLSSCGPEELLHRLLSSGLFVRIRARPCNVLAHPQKIPRSIFVKAIETAPLSPPIHMQLQGRELQFLEGVRCLLKLTPGKVHIVTTEESPIHSLCQSLPVDVHTIEGPHPAAHQSIHIQHIDPITSPQDVVWTLSLLDTIAIGEYSLTGHVAIEQVIAVAGTGVQPTHRRFVSALPGTAITSLLNGGCIAQPVRIISGDPLTGTLVTPSDFFRNDTVLSVLPEPSPEREFLHFMRLSSSGYTATQTYLEPHKKTWSFTTSRHGEHRPFIDGAIYDRVMPFSILPMFLIKALMARDFDKAVEYGLLEIIPEDFALADFICPSKIGMMQVVFEGQRQYVEDHLT